MSRATHAISKEISRRTKVSKRDAMREIERRFLVDERGLPIFANVAPSASIRQAYLCRGLDVRVRHTRPVMPKAAPKGVITLKFARIGASRFEIELPIPAVLAKALVKLLPCRVEKRRYRLPAGNGLTWEIDRYVGALQGLTVAEIELAGESDVPRPGWLGRELTSDRRYDNHSLAFDGLPQP